MWGALGAALPKLPTAKFDYVMVVDSSVKGPFLPVYAQQVRGRGCTKFSCTKFFSRAWCRPCEGCASSVWSPAENYLFCAC